MKLRIPHGLRAALLACFSAVPCLPTFATGTLTAGAVAWLAGMQVQAAAHTLTTDEATNGYTATGSDTLTISSTTSNITGNITANETTVSGGTKVTIGAESDVTTNGKFVVNGANTELELLGDLTLNGDHQLNITNGASVTVNGGTVNTSRLMVHNADSAATDTFTINSGTVNVTKSYDSADNGATLLLGHWPNGSGMGKLEVAGGTLNVLKGTTVISWDADGYFLVSGGTANLKTVSLSQGTSNGSNDAKLEMTGGTLNIGSGGIKNANANTKIIDFYGGTLGVIDSDWSFASGTMNIKKPTGEEAGSGTLTIDTRRTQAFGAEGDEGYKASGTGAVITLAGAVVGNGDINKVGEGTLKFTGKTGDYTGNLTVSAGTVHADAWAGTGNIILEAGSTLTGTVSKGTVKGTGSLGDAANAFTLNGATIDFGTLSGTALSNTLTATGTLTLTSGHFHMDGLTESAVLARDGGGAITLVALGDGGSISQNISWNNFSFNEHTILAQEGGRGYAALKIGDTYYDALFSADSSAGLTMTLTASTNTMIWTGDNNDGGDGTWTAETGTQWGGTYKDDAVVIFGKNATATVTLGSNVSPRSISVEAGGTYTLAASEYSITDATTMEIEGNLTIANANSEWAGTVDVLLGGRLTVSNDSALGSSTLHLSGGTYVIDHGDAETALDYTHAGTVAVGSASTITVASGDSLTLSGVLSGSALLTLSRGGETGSGTVTLSNEDNSLSGGIVVENGITLKAGNSNGVFGNRNGSPSSAGNTVTIMAGGVVDINGKNELNYNFVLAGGSLLNDNTSDDPDYEHRNIERLTLSADSTIGGEGSFYIIGQGYSAAYINLEGYTLTKTGGGTVRLYNPGVTGTAGTIDIREGVLGIARGGTLGDTAFKFSGGDFWFGRANKTDASSLTIAGAVSVASNADISVWSGDSLTLSGELSGSGSLTLKRDGSSGTATVTLSNTGSTHTGGIVVEDGVTLKAGASGAVFGTKYTGGETGNRITIQSGGTVDINGHYNLNYRYVLAGGELLNQASGTAGDAGKSNIGSIELTADSAIGGAGSFFIGDSFSNFDNVNATLKLNGHTLTKKGGGTVNLVGTDVEGGDDAPGTIEITGGTLKLANYDNKKATISGFTNTRLKIGSGSAFEIGLGSSGKASIEFVSLEGDGDLKLGGYDDKTLKINTRNNETHEFKGEISGGTYNSGRLEIAGSGTQTLSGTSTYTGGTTISGGTVKATSAKALGSGNVTITGGKLVAAGTGSNALNVGDSSTVTVKSGESTLATLVKKEGTSAMTLAGVEVTAEGIANHSEATVSSILGAKLTIMSSYMVSGITLDDSEITFGSTDVSAVIKFADLVINANSAISTRPEGSAIAAEMSGANTLWFAADNTAQIQEVNLEVGADGGVQTAAVKGGSQNYTSSQLNGVHLANGSGNTLQLNTTQTLDTTQDASFTFTGLTGLTDGTYSLDAGQILAGAGLDGYTSYTVSGGNTVTFNATGVTPTPGGAIPEPATATLSLLALAACAARRRRQGR